MIIDKKEMNFKYIHIPRGKLYIVSIIGQQEYGATKNLNGLNLFVHKVRYTFYDSIKN